MKNAIIIESCYKYWLFKIRDSVSYIKKKNNKLMNYQKKLPLAEKPKVQKDIPTSAEKKKKNRSKINEKLFEESQFLKVYIIAHPTQRTRVHFMQKRK